MKKSMASIFQATALLTFFLFSILQGQASAAIGDITTVAGNGRVGSAGGSNSLAVDSLLSKPQDISLDSVNNALYIVDRGNYSVRKIDLATGVLSTVAGDGITGFSGDGSLATAVHLSSPRAVSVDGSGNLFITDISRPSPDATNPNIINISHRIRKVTKTSGLISTVAGSTIAAATADVRANTVVTYGGDLGNAVNAQLSSPAGTAIDVTNNLLFIADNQNNIIRKVDLSTGIITTVAGTVPNPATKNNSTAGFSGDGGLATAAQLHSPSDIAVDAAGNLFIADTGNHRIRKIAAVTGIITTIAGTDVYAEASSGTAVTGNHYILDAAGNPIQKIDPSGTATAVTGTSTLNAQKTAGTITLTGVTTTVVSVQKVDVFHGFSGDNGSAIYALINAPQGVSVDSTGNVFIADTHNQRIRKINTAGIMTTVAGNGTMAFGGDGGQAVAAQLNFPQDVEIDAAGNLYIADLGNHSIRKVDVNGIITSIAGKGTIPFGGDNGAATVANLNYPDAAVRDGAGNLYIADTANNRIRKVDASGTISTVAGNGIVGNGGDNGTATTAQLNAPKGVVVDTAGNLFIADTQNHRIRKVDTNGIITTFAGNGSAGFSGDGGQATAAQLNFPQKVTIANNTLYIVDRNNQRVRAIDIATGVISTFAGNGLRGLSGDNGLATAARLDFPQDVIADNAGHIFIADTLNHRVRQVNIATGVITTVVGTGLSGFSGDGALAVNATLSGPNGLGIDTVNNHLYIADTNNQRIRRVDLTTGKITTVAGTGTPGFNADNILATASQLDFPEDVSVAANGDIFITDVKNHRIRKVQNPAAVTNTPPTATDDHFSLTIPATDLTTTNFVLTTGNVLSNDVDADGDAITLLSVDSVSNNGASIQNNGNNTFTYTKPRLITVTLANGSQLTVPALFIRNDRFQYRVKDSQGSISTGIVTITLVTPPAPSVTTSGGSGAMNGVMLLVLLLALSFAGYRQNLISRRSYDI